MKPLSPKQARFVAEYLIDLNAAKAYIRAGYSPKNAETHGPRLARNGQIASAIGQGKAKQLDTAELSAVRVLEEYRRLAFSDARQFWHPDGRLKAMQELTAEQGAVLAGFEAVIKNAAAGDGVTDTVHKIKLWDKNKALECLAKHFGLLEDKVIHSGQIVVKWLDEE